MNIETRDSGDIRVVVIEGRIDAHTTATLEDQLNKMVDGGAHKLVLDFQNLDFISSAGLRTLLSTAKRVRAAGGDLKVCALNSNVREVFDITGFSTIFSVTSNADEAIAAF
jgi:anti-anti-sigma factor